MVSLMEGVNSLLFGFGDKMSCILIIDTKSMSLADQEIIKEVISSHGTSCEVAYYELGNHIAKGGHSSCYQVRKFKGITKEYLGEEAVLKIINPKENAKLAAVFENEVKVLRILNGEHCNRFSRYYTHWKCSKTQRCYILLEKCAYGSLLEFCQHVQEQGKFLTQLEILFFLREILKAVRAMHNLKMLHRDLKLQNVLISGDLSVKLIDFGLSKVSQEGKQPSETKYEGTPFYMSPQIVKGMDYSYEADMWAIGVILYYLMYFEFPFYGSTKPQLKDLVLNAQIRFQQRPEYKGLIDIGMRLLNRDKEMRSQADKLLKDNIFQKIEKEKDIAQRIYYKYENYFKVKLIGYKWKRHTIEEPINLDVDHYLQLNYYTSNQQKQTKKAKFMQFVKQKSVKTQKVKIIKLMHNIKYGFFFLLSNLSLFGYFNNSKILLFHPSLLQKTQDNEQTILCCMFDKHFKETMAKHNNQDPDLQFDEPNCSIAKVSLVKDTLFVRLNNNVLQVYLTKSAKAEDGSFIFTLQLHYNTNTANHKQIAIVNSDGSIKTYKNYQQASNSHHSKYVNYVKDIFQIIIDNSCISFDQLQLKRNL